MNAKFNPSLGDIKGKVGGVVFQGGSSGAILRRKGAPVDPFSPAQSVQRNQLSGNAKSWSGYLTTEQRAAWDSLAGGISNKDAFGLEIGMTGYQLYMKLNTNMLNAGLSRLTDAPDNLDAYTLTLAEFGEHLVGSTTIEVFVAPVIPASSAVWVEGVLNQSPAVAFVSDKLRFFGQGGTPANDSFTVTVPERFGVPVDGRNDWLLVRGFNQLNGVLSPGILISQLPAVPGP